MRKNIQFLHSKLAICERSFLMESIVHKIIYFFLSYKKHIGYVVVSACMLSMLYLKYYQKKRCSPYHLAHVCYTKWIQNKEELSIEQLLPLLKKHPELAKKYDALIAQVLLSEGVRSETEAVLGRLIARNQSTLPSYYQLSYVAQCMLRKDFDAALDVSLQLKEKANPDSYLYGLNLIHIASIYRALGDVEQEKYAWNAVYDFLQDSKNDPKGIKKELNKLYRQENTSFCEYLSAHCL